MMNIPYVDIGAQTKLLKKDLLRAIEEVLDHGNFILGQEVQSFEEAFAAYCGVRFAVGVNSGTDALFLSLKALGIEKGDEVITAPNSFIASASVIIAAGAKPVFVDVRNDYNINPDLIEQAITPRTRAIMPVHLTGRPADMNPILEIAGKYKIQHTRPLNIRTNLVGYRIVLRIPAIFCNRNLQIADQAALFRRG